jgi:D-inositol-3-phosphate glycosyltransferase
MTTNRICYDLIHSHYWLSGSLGRLAQERWYVPHVMMFHTTGIAKRMACGQEREPFVRLITEKRLACASDRILAATENEKKLLMHYYNVPGENIGVVPCGVNLQQFQPVAEGPARKELGLHDSQFIALYVGRFAPVKGLERFLGAAFHLRYDRKLRCVIVGGDDQKTPVSTELRRLAKRASLGGIVQFRGRIEHDLLPLYYSAADVLVMPSYYESFGLVAMESLACGTPVIATRVGAMDTLIQDGRTGFLVDSPSPLSLASAIENMMVARSKSTLSPDQIRASVLGYDWSDVASAIAREYASVYRSIAHRKAITRD